jgi:hypothetical protein
LSTMSPSASRWESTPCFSRKKKMDDFIVSRICRAILRDLIWKSLKETVCWTEKKSTIQPADLPGSLQTIDITEIASVLCKTIP